MKNKSGAVVNKKKQVILHIVIGFGSLIVMYPVLFCFIGSFAGNNLSFENAKLFAWPVPFAGVSNYIKVFQNMTFLRSFIITVLKVAWAFVMMVITSVLAGYVFAKFRFFGKRFFFFTMLSSMMIPSVALLVPGFIWGRHLPLVGGNNILGQGGMGLINNPIGLVITGWVRGYNVFLCRQAFGGVDRELHESAMMDGAGFFRDVFVIHMPIIRPIIAVIFLGIFLGNWNDYLNNLIYMPYAKEWWTMGNAIIEIMNVYSDPNSLGGPDYPMVFAISFVAAALPIAVYIVVQKQFVEGLAMGAVKG